MPPPDAPPETEPNFDDLALPEPLRRAVAEVGYEQPSPIQARAIPPLLEGRDLLGVAQTGTGKTAAFLLPLLALVDLERKRPQLLVLTPTRELAVQVAEATKTYGRYLPGLRTLPVYGGQGMGLQLKQLRRGVHVVVGTPGRIQDHLNRGTLKLDEIAAVVLDEADEMLRMGFLEEVTTILAAAPPERQTALFSATMPPPIRKVAAEAMRDPVEVRIASKTATVSTVRQRYWRVRGASKLDALTRILEAEDIDAVLIFARTKTSCAELAEKLEARGFAADALHGDMNQAMRERTVERLKTSAIDVVVATDVAARGLDVERISHVVNFDIPYDTESYVHRIGRTGRAGRAGEAILFVTNRERRMLQAIERATRQKLEKMELPTRAEVSAQRIDRFKDEIAAVLEDEDLDDFRELVAEVQKEKKVDLLELAAGLAFLAQREKPLDLGAEPEAEAPPADLDSWRSDRKPNEALQNYRIEVGRRHGLAPGNIVGALVNEAGLSPREVGRIDLGDDHSFVELPGGMPHQLQAFLAELVVCGEPLGLRPAQGRRPPPRRGGPRTDRKFRGKRNPAAFQRPGRKGRREVFRKPGRRKPPKR